VPHNALVQAPQVGRLHHEPVHLVALEFVRVRLRVDQLLLARVALFTVQREEDVGVGASA